MAKTSTVNSESKPNVPIIPELRTIMDQLKLPVIDINKLTESTRKDVEALVAANEVAQRTLDTLVRRQADQLAETMNQWQADTKDLFTGKAVAEVASRQVEQSQQVLARVLGNAKEIAEFVSKSHEDMSAILKRRVKENVEEFQSRLNINL